MIKQAKIISKKIGRVIEHPSVLLYKILGVQQTFAFYCLSIKDFMPQIKTILDVGAGTGYFTKACSFIFPKAEIHAFEPVKKCYEELRKSDYPNTKVYNFGLWNENDEILFNINHNGTGVSSFLKRTKLHEKTFNVKLEEVEVKTIVKRFDDLDIKIKRPCLLKIDTEGADFRVLKGFGKRLNEVDLIQIEWLFEKYYEGTDKLSEVISYLEGYGFNSFIQKAVQISDDKRLLYCDLIFMKVVKQDGDEKK